jgi:predicted  nucleic acid-binding Zn-ribbon protein
MQMIQERDLEIQRLHLTNRELVDRIEDHQSNLKQMKYRLELIERENQNSSEEIQKYRQKKMKLEQEKCGLERQVRRMREDDDDHLF